MEAVKTMAPLMFWANESAGGDAGAVEGAEEVDGK